MPPKRYRVMVPPPGLRGLFVFKEGYSEVGGGGRSVCCSGGTDLGVEKEELLAVPYLWAGTQHHVSARGGWSANLRLGGNTQ